MEFLKKKEADISASSDLDCFSANPESHCKAKLKETYLTEVVCHKLKSRSLTDTAFTRQVRSNKKTEWGRLNAETQMKSVRDFTRCN